MEYYNLPDIKGLAALRAIVERGGVNGARSVLKIGQPTVTKRLRALESSYSVPLMERKGRKLALTEAGELVYAYAKLVLDRQATLREDLAALLDGQTRLRLEVNFAIGEHLLPDLLLRFADAYPEYRIETRMGYSRGIETHLATAMTDLALLEQAPDHPDILVQKWLDDELLLVCGPGHPLWGADFLLVTQLTSLRYVLREANSSMRKTLDRALSDIGFGAIPVAMEVGSTDTIVEMLSRGRHVSFLPKFAVDAALGSGTLFHIKVQGLRIMRTLWIARTRSNLNNPVAEAFIALLRTTN
jgi:DNA-binding transcriptional LysR family regulator